MITDQVLDNIQKQFKHLSRAVGRAIIQTPTGWRTPHIQLALVQPPTQAPETFSPLPTLTLPPLEWKGIEFSEFEQALSDELFYLLADFYSPEKRIYRAYLQYPQVDGERGETHDHKYFTKLGQTMRYAQSLIKKNFRDKNKRIHFPNLDYQIENRVQDVGPYAYSVVIEWSQTNEA